MIRLYNLLTNQRHSASETRNLKLCRYLQLSMYFVQQTQRYVVYVVEALIRAEELDKVFFYFQISDNLVQIGNITFYFTYISNEEAIRFIQMLVVHFALVNGSPITRSSIFVNRVQVDCIKKQLKLKPKPCII